MMNATKVRDVSDKFRGSAELYRCEPGGILPEYVVVSAVTVDFIHEDETYIFASNADGVVTDWTELDGSFKGAKDIPLALAYAGYEVAP